MEKSGELSANGQEKAIAWKQHPGISPSVVFPDSFRAGLKEQSHMPSASLIVWTLASRPCLVYRGA